MSTDNVQKMPATTRLSQARDVRRDKAQTLVEALPWIKRFQDATVVIKFGGNAMVDDSLISAFAADVAFLRYSGIKPVVVHGGGPQISAMLARVGLSSEFKDGLRVTTPQVMEIVRMVLTGQVGRDLVGRINQHGPIGVGMSGEDAGLFQARRRASSDPESDVGLVGDVVHVDPAAVTDLIDAGRVPVVSSIAPNQHDPHEVLNVNADAAAAALAQALTARKLVILTDVEGVYADWPDRASLLSTLSLSGARNLVRRVDSGMIPKLKACIDAVAGGVPQAHIVDGREPHALLLELLTPEGVGTLIEEDS